MSIVIIIIIALVLLALFLFWSNKALVLTKYSYKNSKIKGDLDGLVITQVSDIQSTYFGNGQKNIFNMVKDSNPDIIVYTGDLIDRNHTNYEAGLLTMAGLVKIAPVYYINGNHELALPDDETSNLYSQLEKMGVHVVLDKVETFTTKGGASLNILGLSESTIYGNNFEKDGLTRKALDDMTSIENMIENLTEQVNASDFNVLLAHEPQYIKSYEDKKIDLVFSGHAHGGQIRLPFTDGIYAPGQGLLPKITSGMRNFNYSTIIISRGIGNSTFPFRIFNRPEIVRVLLREE